MSAKKADTRIYAVADSSEIFLVRATSQAQALRHVTRSLFTVKVASQDDIIEALGNGATVETANEQSETEGNGEAQ